MYGRWRAGHNRNIVGIGECRQDRVSVAEIADVLEQPDGRKDSVWDASIEVRWIASIQADNDGRHRRRLVVAAVDFDHR